MSVCFYCAKAFTPAHEDARFCSRDCNVWSRTGWRRLLLHRDGHKCQVCKVLQDKAPKAVAAHLLATARLDPEGPGTAENMVTACRGCWRMLQGSALPAGALGQLVEATRARDAAGGIPDGLALDGMAWERIREFIPRGV